MDVVNTNQNNGLSGDKYNTTIDGSLAFNFALCSDVSTSAESVMEYLSPLTKASHAVNIMEGLRGLVVGNTEANIILNKVHEQRLKNISKMGDLPAIHSNAINNGAETQVKTAATTDPGSLEGISGPSLESALGDDEITGYAV